MINSLSVAICTRNRQNDLFKCINSIVNQSLMKNNIKLNLFVIDDGNLKDDEISNINDLIISNKNMKFTYIKKKNPGLFLSRITALENTDDEILLYLDDDVILDDLDYINKLVSNYNKFPNMVAIGGVDSSIKFKYKRKILNFIIGYDSGKAGLLSKSGYGGSMWRWKNEKSIFKTEFLHGCNMSFKTKYLQNGMDTSITWLNDYSLGEDIVLAQFVKDYGDVCIDPSLKVIHNHSLASRDNNFKVAESEVMNHLKILDISQKNKLLNKLFFAYTNLFLVIISYLKKDGKHKGYLSGFRKLMMRDAFK